MLIPTQQNGLSPEEFRDIALTYGLSVEQVRRRRITYRDISELNLVGPVVTVLYEEITQEVYLLFTIGYATGPYANALLADLPYMLLPLNDPSGTNAVGSVGGRNGTYAGGVTLAQASLLSGYSGDLSVLLDGVDGRINTTDSTLWANAAWTLEGWANRASNTTNDTLVGSATTPNQIILRINLGGNDIGFWNNGSTGNVVWANAASAPGTPFHWGVTYVDATKVAELFINGVSKGTRTLPGSIIGTPGNIEWGSWGLLNDLFGGNQQYVASYSTVLSATRILAHYNAGVTTVTIEVAALVDSATIPLIFTPSGIEIQARELTDANTITLVFTPSVIEGIERVVVDAATTPILFTVSVVEGREITDAATEPLLFTASSAEAIIAADAATDYLALTPFGIELKARELTDAATVPLLFTPSALETREITDAITTLILFTVSATELKARELTDTAIVPLLFTPSVAEIREITDATTVPLLFTPVAAEVRERTDAITIPFLFTTNAAEVAVLTDSNTANALFTPSGAEVYVPTGLADAGTGILTLTASSVEASQRFDAATASISLITTGLESVIFTETAIAPLKLSASATEALTGADQLVALVVFRPSGVEVYVPAVVYTEAATAILRFTVGGVELYIPLIKPPQYEFEGTAFKQYTAICEEKVYVGIVTNRYVAICEGTIYTATVPYQRWWTRYDTTYQGHHRAFAR